MEKRYSPTYEYGTLIQNPPSGQPRHELTANPLWVGQSVNMYVVPKWLGLRSLRRPVSHALASSRTFNFPKGGSLPRADLDVAQTRSRDARARDADHGVRAALGLALSRAVEEQIRRRQPPEEMTHVGRRVEGRIVVVGQGEGDIDRLVPVVRTADTITVITRAAPGDVPIRVRSVGHDGIDVRIDGAGDDPLVSLQALRNDIGVERRQKGVRLRRNRRQRGDGEVPRSREGQERRRVVLDRGERRSHVVL